MLAECVESDPFAKVKKTIKDLIVKLVEEANEEAEHKGWCDTELSTNEQTRKEKIAKYQVAQNPENTVFSAKRLIGRKFADPVVQADIKLWPFKVPSGAGDKPMIEADYLSKNKKFYAEEISAMISTKMK